MVVLPALSSPSTRILASVSPKYDSMRDIQMPIFAASGKKSATGLTSRSNELLNDGGGRDGVGLRPRSSSLNRETSWSANRTSLALVAWRATLLGLAREPASTWRELTARQPSVNPRFYLPFRATILLPCNTAFASEARGYQRHVVMRLERGEALCRMY